MFGQKGRDLAPLGFPGLKLDLTLKCHGQQTRSYEVIDWEGCPKKKNHPKKLGVSLSSKNCSNGLNLPHQKVFIENNTYVNQKISMFFKVFEITFRNKLM